MKNFVIFSILFAFMAIFLYTNSILGQSSGRVDIYNCTTAITNGMGACTKIGSVSVETYFQTSPGKRPRDSCSSNCRTEIIYANLLTDSDDPVLEILSVVLNSETKQINARFDGKDLSFKLPLDVNTIIKVNSESRGYAQINGEPSGNVKILRQLQLCDSKICTF
jgi:hypothetical protein